MFTHHSGLIDLAHQYAFEIWTMARPTPGQARLPNCATGFLYQDGGRHWVVTAAHAVEDMSHGNQTLITGSVASPIITIVQPAADGRGGNGLNALDGRSTLYFRVGGRLIDLFATSLEPQEVPDHVSATHRGAMTPTGELAREAVDAIASMATAEANGIPLRILDRLMILGFANGITGASKPPIVSPALVAANVQNSLGNHAIPMILSGSPGVSGGPVFRAIGGGKMEIAGVYTHQRSLKLPVGPPLPGSYATHARFIVSACTKNRAPGFQIVDFPC